MLIDITMANFRSIKDPQTLSFAALKDKRMDQTKVQFVSEKLKILRTTAIIGPNGVGKSTAVRALEAIKGIVIADATDENPLRRILAGSLFAYNDVKNQPAEFTIRFLLREFVSEEEPEVFATYTLKADLDHIWERYYRSSSNTVRTSEGSGLGLSIVKEILTLHKATFGVDSTLGQGSTFWFELDLVRIDKLLPPPSDEEES